LIASLTLSSNDFPNSPMVNPPDRSGLGHSVTVS